MKNFPLLHIVFRLFGVFFAEYDPTTNRYEINFNLFVYSSILTLTIQIFNLYITSDLRSNAEAELLLNLHHELMSKLVFTLDYLILFAISVSTIVNIFVHRKKQMLCLNSLITIHLEHSFKFPEKKCLNKLTSLLTASLFIGPILSELINKRLANLQQWLYLLSLYCLIIQYYIGHVFECVLFEYLTYNFEQVKCHRRVLRQCISSHIDLWWISSKLIKLFELNKIVCLSLTKVLISIYWFYHYDLHQLSFLPPLIWQTLVSIIFVACHSWHRLREQVSFVLIDWCRLFSAH